MNSELLLSRTPDLVNAPPPAAASAVAAPARPLSTRSALRALRTDRWTGWHAFFALLMAGLGVLATWTAWTDIFHIAYHDDEYSHIFLVPVVAACTVWVRRMRFRHCKPSGTALGPVIAVGGWLLASFGFYSNYQSLWHFGSIMVVLGCIVSVLGKHVLFRFFPAVAVLVFMIPVPGMLRQDIALPLQKWTAQIAHTALEMVNVPVELSGNRLVVNGHPVLVAEACNGVRGVFALVLVSYAFSFGLPLRNSVRFVVLLASPLITILCNVLRVVPNAWIHGYMSEETGLAFHNYAGWAMLPIAFLILLGIIKVLRWATLPVMKYTLAS